MVAIWSRKVRQNSHFWGFFRIFKCGEISRLYIRTRLIILRVLWLKFQYIMSVIVCKIKKSDFLGNLGLNRNFRYWFLKGKLYLRLCIQKKSTSEDFIGENCTFSKHHFWSILKVAVSSSKLTFFDFFFAQMIENFIFHTDYSQNTPKYVSK